MVKLTKNGSPIDFFNKNGIIVDEQEEKEIIENIKKGVYLYSFISCQVLDKSFNHLYTMTYND